MFLYIQHVFALKFRFLYPILPRCKSLLSLYGSKIPDKIIQVTLNLKIFDCDNFKGILLYLRLSKNFFDTRSILFSESKSMNLFAKPGLW
jgi:hypothetical protein